MSSSLVAPSSAVLPSFDECADALLEQGVLTSPAELHGVLCGLRGGGFNGAAEGALPAAEQALAVTLSGAAAQCAVSLYDAAGALFGEERWDFQPLLPEDDLDLSQRVAALAAWCRGFLGGYAQARVAAAAADRPVATDSAEALRDFAAMAQAGVDDSDLPDDDDSDAEDAERNYMELVEYLRVAVLSIAADTAGEGPAGGTGAETSH